MSEKLTVKQYLEERRALLQRIEPEDFQRAINYSDAAMRMTQAHEVHANHSTIASVNEVALRLCELYPDGLPLTFLQLAEMDQRGLDTPPSDQIPDWWAGKV